MRALFAILSIEASRRVTFPDPACTPTANPKRIETVSLFEKPPEEFPFSADVKSRPAHYQIKSCPSDWGSILIVAGMWALVGSFLTLLIIGTVVVESLGLGAYEPLVSIGIVVVFLACVVWYYLPELLDNMRTVDVTIADDEVSVRVTSPLGEKSWSDPLSVYQGVAQLDHGMQDLGGSKAIIGSVVLKHPDPKKSVPLTIRAQKDLGKKTVKRFAEQLGVPALEGIGDDSGDKALPEGTLLVNTRQSLILKLFYWGCVIVAVGLGMVTGYKVFFDGGDPALLSLPLVFGVTAWLLRMYSSIYVTAMREWQGEIWLRCDAISNYEYRFKPGEINMASRNEGKSSYVSRQQVHTPYITMGVKGRKLPFILDLQGDYVNEKEVYRLARRR